MNGSDQQHWKHGWPSAKVLSQFMTANSKLFENRKILELGSGATGVCGLTAAKLGAQRVWLSDHPGLDRKCFDTLGENIRNNNLEDRCEIVGLNWDDAKTVENFISKTKKLDFILGSDILFDPSTFEGIISTISKLLSEYIDATVWLAYQERDDNWTFGDFFKTNQNIEATLIRRVETDSQTIQLISIVSRVGSQKMYGGIEGGGTHSNLVLIDESGKKRITSESIGTNYYLQGVESVGDHIAQWIRSVASENSIQLPLEALGMGLSGAEDEESKQKFTDYLRQIHGDVAKEFYLTSDAVSTVAANFEDQGIVLIAGTGSSCRMLMRNGEVKGAGGWGHAIGDGGSGYWLTNRAVRLLFDVDDGIEESQHSVETIRHLLCSHFKISDKLGLLDVFYTNFQKPKVAGFAKILAENAEDPAIAKIFEDGGEIMGKHVRAVTRHLGEDDREEVNIVLVGNVFKSWKLLRNGFKASLENCGIRKINIFEPSEDPAVGSAVIAAKLLDNVNIVHAQQKKLIDTIDF